MQREEDLNQSNIQHYRKLYFVWYYDDDEGYGIEVFGERIAEEAVPSEAKGSLFSSVVNWSFGHGTEARDLRRSWGEYVANEAQKNGGVIPPEIVFLRLRYDPDSKAKGDLDKINKLLGKIGMRATISSQPLLEHA